MNTNTTNTTYTLERYMQLIGEAAEILAQLTAYVEDHGDVAPDDVNETHVNSMAYIVRHLNAAKRQAAI